MLIYSLKDLAIATLAKTATSGTTTIPEPSSEQISMKLSVLLLYFVEKKK